eukprot:CAMPEP_0182821528 /NCGR_PEP_ID=MMETSP0006_2-20121128/13715_1 /TAXON_ID=97485 /ORGANISM="Prymnesium parvum, Strain Texoma1" /LENGTH=173 /DNA_ID=CAMNT_0024948285 /DNA_START=258 /DNA_END=776 /DNA_ORIENTATION=-
MSSTLSNARWPGHDFSGNACIDGVWGGGQAVWSFCHTASLETNPWLSVQLAARSYVSSVLVYGRSDCCRQYLAVYEIWVGDAAGEPQSAGLTRCGVSTAPATVGPFSMSCGLVGTYVTLRLPGSSRWLMIDELVVSGSVVVTPAPTAAPTATPTPSTSPGSLTAVGASMSSTL